MFDVTHEIEITIYSGGPKSCTVVFPADADWKRRAKRIRIKQESAGGGRTKASVIGAEPAALDMFSKIRRDSGEAFDAAEAIAVIDRLEYCDLAYSEDGEPSVQIGGDRITVRMGALKHRGGARFGDLVHVLRHPTMKQTREYKLGCVDLLAAQRGSSEMTQPLEPGESLYDALVIGSEGYGGAVPVIHKDFVVTQVLEAIRALDDGGDAVA